MDWLSAWCSAWKARQHEINGLQLLEEKKVGEGGFATIWRCRLLADRGEGDELPGTMALKKTLCQDEERLDFARSEVQILRRASLEGAGHPGAKFILRYFADKEVSLIDSSTEVQLLLEWCSGGCLLDSIMGGKAWTSMPRCPNMREVEVIAIMQECASALDFLHDSLAVVHYDLKPENLLLSAGHIRLCDFGSASSQQWPDFGPLTSRPELHQVELFFNQRTTPIFRPPEIADPDLARLPITGKADMFMLGLCLYQMLFAVHAFPLEGSLANFNAKYSLPPDAKKSYSEAVVSTLQALLQRQPQERPSARKLRETGLLELEDV
eukprot:TRINITY_DN85383_c0_g1_i1.p1 TRINITY_DN85383_c0_g1~~TRINITY_DN85383_c0_g1_i1.p1  ORF type:complete len:324 (-),score=74.77 TRINITY_DN85383_c0_g1_i1:24-995(-)